MIQFSDSLKYYARSDIKKILVESASSRELGVKFSGKNGEYFGKRPDVLLNEADVLEFAKNGATSFHISEEHWSNPLALNSNLSKKEQQELRTGWDFIVDIDCPDWELSVRIAHAVMQTFIDHGINCASCKFSGNKGFHIGIPCAAFPQNVGGLKTSLLFPDKVKTLMEYVIYWTEKNHTDKIIADVSLKELAKRLQTSEDELIKKVCVHCSATQTESVNKSKETKYEYVCMSCGKTTISDKNLDYISCSACKSLVSITKKQSSKICQHCKKELQIRKQINLRQVLKLDSVLISARHLYRMPYSLHEKSGLASIVIPLDTILLFDKKNALPENIKVILPFMPYNTSEGADSAVADFVLKALDFKPPVEKISLKSSSQTSSEYKEFNDSEVKERIPEECFPPAIVQMLAGLKDGKKRALFVLVNFLTSVGWSYQEIEDRLTKWNTINPEPLRERVIKSQLSYHIQQNKKVLPPNYTQNAYYGDLGVGSQIELSGSIKNPVFFAQRLFKEYVKQNKRKKTSSQLSEKAKPIQ